jgi:hypothetical protein
MRRVEYPSDVDCDILVNGTHLFNISMNVWTPMM